MVDFTYNDVTPANIGCIIINILHPKRFLGTTVVFGVEAFALDNTAFAGVGGAVGNLEVVEVAEPAPYLLGGEEVEDGGQRREEEKFLPRLGGVGRTVKQHGVDEALCGGG